MNAASSSETPANEIARRFGCDHALLEQTLRQVQAGEISPAEATTRLLSMPTAGVPSTPTNPSATESLASLIARLGTPPRDIIDSWCEQMRIAAVEQVSISGQPLSEIDLNDWAINQSGQLLCNGRLVPANKSVDPEAMDAVSARQIQNFRDSLIPADTDSIPAASALAAPAGSAEFTGDASAIASENAEKASSDRKSKRQRSQLSRVMVGGLVVALAGAIVWILLDAANQRGPAKTDSVARSSTKSPLDEAVTGEQTPAAITTDASESALPEQTALESFDDWQAEDPISEKVAVAGVGVENSEDYLSLESFMPAASGFAELDPAADTKPQDVVAEAADDEAESAGPAESDPLSEEEATVPQESPQPTRKSEVTSVTLPATGDIEVATNLSAIAERSFRLEFPFDVPLGLRDIDDGREIIDVRSEVAVATVTATSAGLQHRWTATASKTASSTALIHGRLKTDSGDVVYLRPTIEADLWPIDLQRADVRPTWDLLGPMPPRATRFSIEFDLPAGIEEAWIEPIDPTSPRRSRAVAVLTPTDGESVALGVRFDIRGGRKLSCRVRYAARLDTAAPWQLVSDPMLQQLSDQLTSQAEQVSQQITHMSALYANADSGERRFLAPRREAIEQRADSLRQISDRLAELQSLVGKVEAGAKLKLSVWVQWPGGGSQTLLKTK